MVNMGLLCVRRAHGNQGGLYLDIGDGVIHALSQRLAHAEEGREGRVA